MKPKKTEQLLKFHGSAKQDKLYSPNTEGFQHELSSRSCGEARAWANVEMVSRVADPHKSETKCATNKRRESHWYLSEGLLLATLATNIEI